jgi:hypothetical protein
MPVTQKKVRALAINMNISNLPTSSIGNVFVKTIVTIRKVIGLIS